MHMEDLKQQWLILGNSREHKANKGIETTIGNGKKRIVFNNRKIGDYSNTLNICNKKNSRSPRFDTVGQLPYLGFDNDLYRTAVELQRHLNNWPSIGLTTMLTLSRASIHFDIHWMNLFPVMARQNQTDLNRPLPSYFHNWLGERRVAFNMLPEPDYSHVICKLKLDCPEHSFDCTSVTRDPFTLLEKLQFEDSNLSLVQDLASIDISVWLQSSTNQKLIKAERYFHLPRTKAHTMHWWLFNYQASQHMNHVRYVLAYCQQQSILGLV